MKKIPKKLKQDYKIIRSPNAPELTRQEQNMVNTYVSMIKNPEGPRPAIHIPTWVREYVNEHYMILKVTHRKPPMPRPLPYPGQPKKTRDMRVSKRPPQGKIYPADMPPRGHEWAYEVSSGRRIAIPKGSLLQGKGIIQVPDRRPEIGVPTPPPPPPPRKMPPRRRPRMPIIGPKPKPVTKPIPRPPEIGKPAPPKEAPKRRPVRKPTRR